MYIYVCMYKYIHVIHVSIETLAEEWFGRVENRDELGTRARPWRATFEEGHLLHLNGEDKGKGLALDRTEKRVSRSSTLLDR